MCIVFSGRTRSVLRERGNGLNLIVLNGLSLFIVIISLLSFVVKGAHTAPFTLQEYKCTVSDKV